MSDPRLFAVPLGAPYPAAFAEGFVRRFGARSPDELARITIFANTRRMATAIGDALANLGPALLPKIRTFADLPLLAVGADLPPSIDPLSLRLELTQLVRRFLESDPGVAPPDAAFDIAGTLLTLLGEMASEGVAAERLRGLDLAAHSAHWARSLRFIDLIAGYLDHNAEGLEPEAHARAAATLLVDAWGEAPPDYPIIVAGSTGSRGTTRMLIEAVSALENGYVVLPGFDPVLPENVWTAMGEAHPQYRFAALLEALALSPGKVQPWAGSQADAARAKVLSLAMRPPPVTDQWRSEGRHLPDLKAATGKVTLLEAPGERIEAVAIALGLRGAVEAGKRAALVTPDRVLTRRVAAALARWGIEPDDSAGRPLALSAPGRLLRQVAGLMRDGAGADALLALLKHPLLARGGARGPHLLNTREFELWLRRGGHPFDGPPTLAAFSDGDEARRTWCGWLEPALKQLPDSRQPLADWLSTLVERCESMVSGAAGGSADELWAGKAGEAAREAVDALVSAAPSAGPVSPRDALQILDGVLQGEVRDPVLPHGDVMFRGTMEVRSLDADLVILAGLNEDTWPPAPDPDPWLNRALRREAGLLSPERRTGLSAHDFEMAFSSPEIWLTRSTQSGEGETVASRWLNRFTGLVGGLEEDALKEMNARGAKWLRLADALDKRLAKERPASRPAPRPPVDTRPRRISVTEVQRLVRDPYAIYARRILGLEALPPPLRVADARLRGEALHEIAEKFMISGPTGDRTADRATLREIAGDVFGRRVPSPVTRTLWTARLDRIADEFLAGEYERLDAGTPIAFEVPGRCHFTDPEVTLTGKADRIDSRSDGLAIWDYKSGSLPSAKQVRHFDRQLLLEAVMAERGAFEGIDAATVAEVGHIGLGSNPDTRSYRFDGSDKEGYETDTVSAEFLRLIAAYLDPAQGYTSRRAMESVSYDGDYDHLARFGEWDDTAPPEPEDLS